MEPCLRYTHLGLQLASSLDRSVGDFHGPDFPTAEETIEHVKDGSILGWLVEAYPEIDLGAFDPADREETVDLFQRLANGTDARQAFGIEWNGRCLLVAYCFEGIQQERSKSE